MSHERSRVKLAVVLVPMLLVPVGAVFAARAVLSRLSPLASPSSSIAPSLSSSSAAPPVTPVADDVAEVRGQILDPDGNPVPGAVVRLVAPAPPYASLRDTRSDAAGAFVFPAPPRERVRVAALHDPEGVVTSADLLPHPGAASLTLVLAPSSVRGTVVDDAGKALANVTLAVEGAPWIDRTATSDAAGAFVLTSVPREMSSLVATLRGYATERTPLAPHDDQAELVVRVRLAAGNPIAGDVVDPDGHPLAARVVACAGQASEARVSSGDDGKFELPPSALGCSVYAAHDEYGPSGAVVAAASSRRLSLRLTAGGAIAGVVVDERGGAVPSFSLGVESFSPRNRSGRARKVDDPGGAFRVEKLAPGRYVVTASAAGKPPARSQPLDVSAGVATSGVRIVLSPGGTVTGHVYDASHAPLAGVAVRFDGISSVVGGGSDATTDDSGGYRLDGAPPGPFTLFAGKDGYRGRMLSGLRVAAGATLTEDVTLSPNDGHGGLDFAGIGATIAADRDGVAFGGVMPDTPAARAGLQTGDRVVSVDGDDTSEMSAADVVQRLRGEPGTPVGVSVVRPSTGETIDVVIVRAQISRS